MRKSACFLVAALLATSPCWAQSAAPLGTPPLPQGDRQAGSQPTSSSGLTAARSTGRPENRWRYRFSQGRWWYWTPDNQWSYFNGQRWTTRAATKFSEQRVDPALLRLEAKEGVLGRKKWSKGPAGSAGGGLPMSGTQGTAGGNPSGSFTDPGGTPSAVNTTTGSYFGYGERIGVPARRGR